MYYYLKRAITRTITQHNSVFFFSFIAHERKNRNSYLMEQLRNRLCKERSIEDAYLHESKSNSSMHEVFMDIQKVFDGAPGKPI